MNSIPTIIIGTWQTSAPYSFSPPNQNQSIISVAADGTVLEGFLPGQLWQMLLVPEAVSQPKLQLGVEAAAQLLAPVTGTVRVWLHHGGGKLSDRDILSDWNIWPEWAGDCNLSQSLLDELTRLHAEGLPWGFGGLDGFEWAESMLNCYKAIATAAPSGKAIDIHAISSMMEDSWSSAYSYFDQ